MTKSHMEVAAALDNLHYINLFSHSISSQLYALHRSSFLALNAFKAVWYTIKKVFIKVAKLCWPERLGFIFITFLISRFDFNFE